MRLKDKRILITGGGTGIGKAIALRCAEQGAKILITARRPEPLLETSAGNPDIHCLSADLTAPDGPAAIMREAVRVLGGIDVLVNNSGVYVAPPIDQTTDEIFSQVFDLNVKGLYCMTQAALPELRNSKGANIVNIGSICGVIGISGSSCYSASKGAVNQITRVLAVELGPEKIRVNCICPGMTRTDATDALMNNREFAAMVLPDYPIGRFGEPDDIAHACVFLASDEASWLTGVILPVDGGYTAM